MAIVLVNGGGNTPQAEDDVNNTENTFEFTDTKPAESVLGGPDTRSAGNLVLGNYIGVDSGATTSFDDSEGGYTYDALGNRIDAAGASEDVLSGDNGSLIRSY